MKNELRNQTLIVVEGKLEKEGILKSIFRCFPEIPIRIENVHVYENNIYDLHHAIEKEYGESWYEDNLEINIPFLLNQKFQIEPPLIKKNFTNIIMMFDYEHHDFRYSDEIIMKMQRHFNHIEDEGILYINYPMIESLYHYPSFPDEEYLLRKIPVSCNPGSVYKNAVKEKSCIHEYINLFHELVNKIGKKVGLPIQKIEEGAFALLAARTHEDLETEIKHFINQTKLKDQNKKSLEQTIRLFLSRQKYWDEESSYWEDIRQYFKRIAQDNMIKAYYIQEGKNDAGITIKEKYYSIEWARVLEEQNTLSADQENGIIMVLCTCITFLGEYKFFWK